jgi:hypothetical protein
MRTMELVILPSGNEPVALAESMLSLFCFISHAID